MIVVSLTDQELVQSAKYMITTSISEGFGFSFLEPWMANKSLWGRKLPDICIDFESNHVNLDHLYTKMLIPLDWIGVSAFKKKWIEAYRHAFGRFGQPLIATHIRDRYEGIIEDGKIDFGILNETFQKVVITRLLSNERDKNEIIRLNPRIVDGKNDIIAEERILNNKKAVMKYYHQKDYEKRLIDIYTKVGRHVVAHEIDKSILFSMFITHTNFSLLKWSSYRG